LRFDRVRARGVRLKLKLARGLGRGKFPILTRSQTLPEPSDDGHALALAGCALLARAALEEPIRLVGLAAERLEEACPAASLWRDAREPASGGAAEPGARRDSRALRPAASGRAEGGSTAPALVPDQAGEDPETTVTERGRPERGAKPKARAARRSRAKSI
jgi:hypothetical protein